MVVATMTVVATHCHVHGEAWTTRRRAVWQGAMPVPLIAPATGALEAEQLEDLLHGDFRTDAVEVDAGHDSSPVDAWGFLVEIEEGPFRSHYLYRERGTVLFALRQHVASLQVCGGSYRRVLASPGPRPDAGFGPTTRREAWLA